MFGLSTKRLMKLALKITQSQSAEGDTAERHLQRIIELCKNKKEVAYFAFFTGAAFGSETMKDNIVEGLKIFMNSPKTKKEEIN